MTARASADIGQKTAGAAIEVLPFETGFGAEVRGLDLSHPIDDALFRAWNAAFERHRVLVIRGQGFDDRQHVAFSRRFGELEDFPDPKDQASGLPMVLRVSNVDRDTDTIKRLDDAGHRSFTLGTSDWHTDSSFRRVPSKASLLFAREVPAEGGDTMFANTMMAYEALPEAEKTEIDGLTVVHDFEETRRRFDLPPRPEAIRAANPPTPQPLVRQVPGGGKALLLGMHASYVVGMDAGKSRALLDRLTAWATQDRFTYRHRWRVGDLVMWDNRCTMHKAMPYDMANDRRLLHRTTVAGDGPLV